MRLWDYVVVGAGSAGRVHNRRQVPPHRTAHNFREAAAQVGGPELRFISASPSTRHALAAFKRRP